MTKRRKKAQKAGTVRRRPEARLDAGLRAVVREHHDEEKRLRLLEQVAKRNPALAATYCVQFAQGEEEFTRNELLRRYGVEVGHFRGPEVTTQKHPERAPKTLRQRWWYVGMHLDHIRWHSCLLGMLFAAEKAHRAGKDYDLAVCAAFLEAQRQAFDLPAIVDHREEHPVIREMLIALLGGRVVARTSLSRNKRLRNALSSHGDPAFDRFLKELPAAVLLEWDKELESFRSGARSGPSYVAFSKRVIHSIAKEGSETVALEGRNKLADKAPTSLTDGGPSGLDEFAAREELRATMEAAHLAERERQVMELMLPERTVAEIAEALGISEGSVKTLRSRARKKMRKAAGR